MPWTSPHWTGWRWSDRTPRETPPGVPRVTGRTPGLDQNRGDASWRATGDEDLPPDVVEPDRCGSLIWMPRTRAAIREHLPMEIRTLPQSTDPSGADIKGVIAVTAPTVQDAVDRPDRLVEPARQCPTDTATIVGSSPTDLMVTEVPLRETDRTVDLVESRQGETLVREVHAITRVDNLLVTVTRPGGDTIRAHRHLAATIGQLRATDRGSGPAPAPAPPHGATRRRPGRIRGESHGCCPQGVHRIRSSRPQPPWAPVPGAGAASMRQMHMLRETMGPWGHRPLGSPLHRLSTPRVAVSTGSSARHPEHNT